RRHTRWPRDWSSDVCSSDLGNVPVLGKRVVIPDHKIFFVDFDDPEPAYYLCGLLNCSTVRMFIQSHTISIQIGNIFKHMSLPERSEERRVGKECRAG